MLTFRQFITEARKEDDYYYHITKGSNMGGIAKRGLNRKPGHRSYSFSKRGSVYLSSTPASAKQYAPDMGTTLKARKGPRWQGDKYVAKWDEVPHSLRVIRIPKTSIDPKKLHRDRNMEWARDNGPRRREKPTEWEYAGDIPAKKIEFSGGEHLKKKSRAWRQATDD